MAGMLRSLEWITMSLEDQIKQSELEDQMSELRTALLNAQKQLAKAKLRNDELVVATHRGAYEAMLALGKVEPVPAPKKDLRKANGEVALVHSTDWQGAKVTTSYNSEIMRQRVLQFADKILHQYQRHHEP